MGTAGKQWQKVLKNMQQFIQGIHHIVVRMPVLWLTNGWEVSTFWWPKRLRTVSSCRPNKDNKLCLLLVLKSASCEEILVLSLLNGMWNETALQQYPLLKRFPLCLPRFAMNTSPLMWYDGSLKTDSLYALNIKRNKSTNRLDLCLVSSACEFLSHKVAEWRISSETNVSVISPFLRH